MSVESHLVNTRQEAQQPGPGTKPSRSTMHLLIGWSILLLSGLTILAAYSNAAGLSSKSLIGWPTDSSMKLASDRPTVVFFLHPKCGCSRSTMREFHRIAGTVSSSFEIKVGLFCPRNEDLSWTMTPLRDLAEQLSPHGTFEDIGGIEAARFGVTTSGHGFVFAPTGEALFSGGITASRGHEGANLGVSQMKMAIETLKKQPIVTSVFGCLIRSDHATLETT